MIFPFYYYYYYFPYSSVALTSLGNLQGALDAALKSIETDSEYVKGIGRVANAYFNIENFTEAKRYFELALSKDPDNKTYKEGLLKAQQKIAQVTQQTSRLSPMSGNGNARSGAGGLDFPQMPDMMNNELMQNLMSQMGQGGGDIPNIQEFIGNPDLMNNIQKLMQQPGMIDLAKNMFSNLGKNPEFVNQMKNAFSSIPGGKNIPKQVIDELKMTEEYQKSTKIRKFVQELEQNGAQAWADNMADEEIMQFMQKLGLNKMNGNPNLFGAGNTGSGRSQKKRDDDDDTSSYYM